MRGLSTLLAVAFLLIAGLGCGTSESDRVEVAFKEWLVAAAEDDHERRCELTTTRHRRQAYARGRAGTSIEDCVAILRREETPATPRQKRNVKDVEIVNVEIDGDAATAFLRLRGCTRISTETTFRRTAKW